MSNSDMHAFISVQEVPSPCPSPLLSMSRPITAGTNARPHPKYQKRKQKHYICISLILMTNLTQAFIIIRNQITFWGSTAATITWTSEADHGCLLNYIFIYQGFSFFWLFVFFLLWNWFSQILKQTNSTDDSGLNLEPVEHVPRGDGRKRHTLVWRARPKVKLCCRGGRPSQEDWLKERWAARRRGSPGAQGQMGH